jgi:hypothetical protein
MPKDKWLQELENGWPFVTGYKLFRLRKNGTLGSLFIDAKKEIPVGKWLVAKSVRTPGFAYRPGWHACSEQSAPHLSKKGRVWARVSLASIRPHHRPASQGGLWFTAQYMKIEEVLG